MLFINLLTVLLFQHLFQTQYLRFYSTYQRVPPLSAAASPYSSFFSLYLAFIVISCVWINVVDIKPNLCLYYKFSSKSNRFIMEDKSGIDLQFSSIQGYCSPEVELPMTVDGWPRHSPHQEVGEHRANILWACRSCRRSWNIQWLQIGNLLESTQWGAET